ncbi:MAG TPA: uroporphyrinogen-III synthase [Acidobacteriaceae bacterium]|jgi:uroporphyrinogen-III synthase|nr:uroporphyrinogen-III synthase [Acidobacteriaceae bacterium]
MKPLAGRRILITRARHQAGSLLHALQDIGAEVITAPTIEIVPPDSYASLDDALRDIAHYDWLILTSANGVAAMWNRMQLLGLSPGVMQTVQFAVVGSATADALKKHDWAVNVMPKAYVAEAVVDALRHQIAGKHVLLVRAKIARDVIPEELTRLGAEVHVVEAYKTVMPQDAPARIKAIFGNTEKYPHAISFTSSSTVKNFFFLLREAGFASLPAGIMVASIGPITSQTLREYGIEPDMQAENHNVPGLVDAMTAYFSHGEHCRRET